ncbi:MAG TPA: GNAT family N-acetyltransferase [Burkholderiales bacterium]|nr:GNAT family N-acetyltransferase [Burkholderiales bacterium]
MIRRCGEADIAALFEIINDAAQAYRGVIPPDRWHEPYMPLEELRREIADGVEFWGEEADGVLQGVMGIQRRGEVDLIRHAYVRTHARRRGVGTRLLAQLVASAQKPLLVGTWADARWAVRFYEKNGFRLLPRDETERLLRRFWNVPARQIETSVVLASPAWT